MKLILTSDPLPLATLRAVWESPCEPELDESLAGGVAAAERTVSDVIALPNRSGESYKINGNLYCAGALPSLSGAGSITLGDFEYSGRVVIDAE